MKVYLMKWDGSTVLYDKKNHNKIVYRYIYWEDLGMCLVCGKDIHTCVELFLIGKKNGFPQIPPDVSGSMECGILSTFVVNRDSPVVKTLSESKKLLLDVLGLKFYG